MATAPDIDIQNPLLHFEQEKWDQLRAREIQDFDLLFVGQKVASVFYSTDEFSKCLNLSVAQKEAVLHKEALKRPLHVQASRLLAKWRENLTSSPVTWDTLILCLLSLNESTRKFMVEAIRQHLFPSAAVEESRQLSLTSSETAYSGPASFTRSDLNPGQQIQVVEVSDDLVPFAIEEKSMPALFQALVVGTTPRDPNRVPYFDREPAKKDLAKKIKVLQRKFARLGILAHSELRNVSLEDLRIFITSISVHEQESIALFSQSMVEMLTTTSVEEVITLCSRIGVWDFFNFQLMVDLAEEFECSTLQQKLTEYGVEIDEFKKNTKLSDFLRVWSGRAPHGSIPDCEPVIVKVDTLWPDFTLHDAAELEGYLASEFKVRQLVFKLSNAREGCVSLMWLVPKSAIAVMKSAMQNMSKKRLKELNIQLLWIGHTMYKVSEDEDYLSLYEESLVNYESFWGAKALQLLNWSQRFDKVLDYDKEQAIMQWFSGGKLNVSENCLDRHVAVDPERIAIIWESDEPNKEKKISYRELLNQTCQIANVLKTMGVHKGDRVIIYMPAMPLVIASMLACARIGAVHCVVFAKTEHQELELYIRDTKAKVVITADDRVVSGKVFCMKERVDKALESLEGVNTVLVASRTGRKTSMVPGRDYSLEKEMSKQSTECVPEPMDSEDDLFIIYTSGTSGTAKGIVHTQAGYLLYATFSLKFTFDYKQGDIFGCVADPGWILGHSYVVYGPLCLGGTSVLYESTATYPHHDRYWKMIERLKVTQFITTPHVLKNLKNYKDTHDIMKSCDLSSLKVFTLLGESLSDDLWNWYSQRLDCCMMDTWWQTELGGTAIIRWSTPDGSIPPCFPHRQSFAFFGVEPYLEKQEKLGREAKGHLYLKKPLPGMGRRINGVGHKEYKQLYFPHGDYYTYDEAKRDAEGGYHIIGRVDNSVRTKGIWLNISTMESTIDESDANIRESLVVTYQSPSGEDIEDNHFMVAFLELKKPADHFSKDEKKQLVANAKNAVFTRLGHQSVPQEFAIVESLVKTNAKKNMRSFLQGIVKHRREIFQRKRSQSTPGTDEEDIPEYNSLYLQQQRQKHTKRLSLPALLSTSLSASPECERSFTGVAHAVHLT